MENVVEELSHWSGAVRWGLSLSSKNYPFFLGYCSPQRYLSGLKFGLSVQACSLEMHSGYILALRRECHQGLQSWRKKWAPRILPYVATLVAYC